MEKLEEQFEEERKRELSIPPAVTPGEAAARAPGEQQGNSTDREPEQDLLGKVSHTADEIIEELRRERRIRFERQEKEAAELHEAKLKMLQQGLTAQSAKPVPRAPLIAEPATGASAAPSAASPAAATAAPETPPSARARQRKRKQQKAVTIDQAVLMTALTQLNSKKKNVLALNDPPKLARQLAEISTEDSPKAKTWHSILHGNAVRQDVAQRLVTFFCRFGIPVDKGKLIARYLNE